MERACGWCEMGSGSGAAARAVAAFSLDAVIRQTLALHAEPPA